MHRGLRPDSHLEATTARSPSVLMAILAATALVLGIPGGAAAKGCEAPTTEAILWLLDGEKIAEFSGTEEDAAEAEALGLRLRELVWSLGIGCYQVLDPVTGARTSQNALFWITRAGAPKAAEMYLAEVVRAQKAHHDRLGVYAPDPSMLSFFGLSSPNLVGVGAATLTVERDGWTGGIGMRELGVVCRVVVGAIGLPREGLERGVPKCFRTSEG